MLLLMPCVLLAQSFRGSIRGHVVDPSGSVIAGAKVTAKNNATGLTREAITGNDGGYVLAELPAGVYAVTAQAASFSPVAQNVMVNVGFDTTADFDLTQVEEEAGASHRYRRRLRWWTARAMCWAKLWSSNW